jgi:hypothetical protein
MDEKNYIQQPVLIVGMTVLILFRRFQFWTFLLEIGTRAINLIVHRRDLAPTFDRAPSFENERVTTLQLHSHSS